MLSVSTLTAGKTININIDFDDVLKIVSEFTNPEVLRRFASEVAQRAGVHQQIYKNPYHPEDDLAESMATLNMLQNKTKPTKDSINSVNKAILKDFNGNSKSDAEIERNNIKYFTSKERSDDELTDHPTHIVNNHTDVELKSVNETVQAKVEPTTDTKKYDTHSDFKRRFVVVSPKSTIDPNTNKDLREIKSLEDHYKQPLESDIIVDTNNDARKRILQSDPRPYSIENLKNNAPLVKPVSFDPKIDVKEIKSLDAHYTVSHEADIIQVDANSDPKQSIVKKSNPLPYSIENVKENAPITSKSTIDLITNKNLKDFKSLDTLYKISHEADILQVDDVGDARKRIVKKSNPVPYSIEDMKDKASSSKPTTDFKEIKFLETNYKQTPESPAYIQVASYNNTRKSIFTNSNPLLVSTGDIKGNKPLGANITNIALGEIDRFHALRRRFEALNKFVENIVAKHKTPKP